MFKGQERILMVNENVRCKCTRRSSRMRAIKGKQLQFIMNKSSKAIEKPFVN